MFQTSVYFLRKNCYQASLFENLLGGSTPPPPSPLQRGEKRKEVSIGISIIISVINTLAKMGFSNSLKIILYL